MNSRGYVRWGTESFQASPIVLPAKIMMSNATRSLVSALESVMPVGLTRLRALVESVAWVAIVDLADSLAANKLVTANAAKS